MTDECNVDESSCVGPNGRKEKGDSVKYRGTWYRLGKGFGRYHPGGSQTLRRFRNRDVSRTMHRWNHSAAAYALMRQYSTDEDEQEVDWSLPMVWQVGKLGKRYQNWVEEPVDRPMVLFDNPLVERATKTTPSTVVAYWIPIICLLVALTWSRIQPSPPGERLMTCLGHFLLGLALWPLIEYLVHRWLFHAKPPPNWPTLITLHFLVHGIHHKVPFDKGRLMFPPGPGSMMFGIGYLLYSCIFPARVVHATLAGTITGYLLYDLVHFYLHYGSPAEGTYLYHMKRYHNQHHFAHQHSGFGISSDFWDRIFDTAIVLRKLDFPLKWLCEDEEES